VNDDNSENCFMCLLLEPIRSGRKPNIAEFRAISNIQDEIQGVGSLFSGNIA